MIQFQILSGQQAGHDVVVRHFPFVIGRGPDSHLRLEDPGVWDQHLQVEFRRDDGFFFAAHNEALALVNGQRAADGLLRNGDLIELGSAQLRFWLARSEQKTMRLREALTWTSLFLLFVAQVGLIYRLLH